MRRLFLALVTLCVLPPLALAEDMDGAGGWSSPAHSSTADADADGRVSSREFEDAYGAGRDPDLYEGTEPEEGVSQSGGTTP